MAAHFTCEEVLQLVTGDTWGDSEGESEEDLDFESGPLDREQEVDLASNMTPLIDHAQENMDTTVSESINEDNSVSESTTLSTSSATPFEPPPFSCPVGPVSFLESDATPFDFFSLFFDNDITDHIVDQTNLYATQKNPKCTVQMVPYLQ